MPQTTHLVHDTDLRASNISVRKRDFDGDRVWGEMRRILQRDEQHAIVRQIEKASW